MAMTGFTLVIEPGTTENGRKVVVEYDDGTFHTDYPVKYPDNGGIAFDRPESIPTEVMPRIRSAFEDRIGNLRVEYHTDENGLFFGCTGHEVWGSMIPLDESGIYS